MKPEAAMLRAARRTAPLVALVLLPLGAGEADARDLVHLRNGRTIEGEVREESAGTVVITVAYGTLHIPRSDIVRIERDQELAGWEVRLRQKLEEELRGRAEAARAARQEKQAGREDPAAKREDERIRKIVEDLASDDPEVRRQARALLEREGKAAIEALTDALFHKNGFARESAATLLGKLRARESVRVMLVALRSSVPRTGARVLPWQRPFVRALSSSLQAVTGQGLRVSTHGAGPDKVVARYVAWWEGEPSEKDPSAPPKGAYLTWDTPQLGEKEIAEDDPEREKKLWEARRIGDERRSYSPPKSFIENPFGEAPGER